MLAGALRIISSFVPYNAASVPLECFYLLIDVCLLLGLLSLYFYQHEQVGRVGFAGFLPALIGAASIIGPDGKSLFYTRDTDQGDLYALENYR